MQCSPPYEEIVELLRSKIRVQRAVRQRAKTGDEAYRLVVLFTAADAAVDLFQNSATGYRAQYLAGPPLGDQANRLVLDTLLPDTYRLIEKLRPSLPQTFVKASLGHPWVKIWVHQGPWLRSARREDRVLHVAKWEPKLRSDDERERKLARWGMLAPEFEKSFVIKGGFVQPTGQVRLGEPPKNRPIDLHTCGFT